MSFPDDLLGATLEAQFNGVWTDLSDRLFAQQLQIRRGRADETSQAQPSSFSAVLNNSLDSLALAGNVDGYLTPGNPLSPWYPYVKRDTLLRLTVPGTPYLLLPGDGPAAERAATPDHSSLDIIGDTDVRLWMDRPANPPNTSFFVGKWGLAGQRSWRWLHTPSGLLDFAWSADGTTFITAQSTKLLPPLSPVAIRIELDVNNGAGGWTVTFKTAPSLDGPWTVLGQPVTGAGTSSVFSSTAPLEAGDLSTGGGFTDVRLKMYRIELRQGIDGTLKASPDFTIQTPGTTTFLDSQGRIWTVSGDASITDKDVRFEGQIAEIAPSWPAGDVSNMAVGWSGHATVAITAAGVLRRLAQAKTLDSALRRSITALNPIAYWPLEDGSGSRSAVSAVQDVPPLGVRPLVSAEFGSDDSMPGSMSLVRVSTGAVFSARVPPSGGSDWSVQFLYLAPGTGPATDERVLDVFTTGTHSRWRIDLKAALLTLRHYNAAGESTALTFAIGADVFQDWTWLRLSTKQSGANIAWAWDIFNLTGSPGGSSGTIVGTAGEVTAVALVGITDWRLGHASVFTPGQPTTAFVSNGYSGERAGARIARLAAEESLPLAMLGNPADSELMGAQGEGTLLSLMQEAAATDLGVLAEQHGSLGVSYTPRTSIYNQTAAVVLSAAANEIDIPLAPIHDDQRVTNDVTASRAGGGSYRAATDGVIAATEDPYPTGPSLSLADDNQTPNQASWRLHMGTQDDLRAPTISVDIAQSIPASVLARVLAIKEGDRMQVTNLPPQYPLPMLDLIVEGISESLSPGERGFEFACSQADSWTVGVFDDPVLGRASSNGSTLNTTITTATTSISIATPSGPLWIRTATHAAEFPFDIRIGGEVMRVTGITGTASSPQTFTVTRAVNGIAKAHTAGAAMALAQPLVAAL